MRPWATGPNGYGPGPNYVAPTMALPSLRPDVIPPPYTLLEEGSVAVDAAPLILALAGGLIGGALVSALAWRAAWRTQRRRP